jgi:peptidyl-prolyl cis-trans isomerase A (cyclophilin A)
MFATAFSRAPARPRRRAVTLAAVAAAALAAACGGRRGPSPARLPAPLVTPDPRQERAAAPDTFDVRFETSRGPFVVRVARAWAPRGADRLYYLVRNGYYTEARFFRVLPRFAAQWGAAADPRINRVWETRTIADDPVRRGNARGTVSFATAGPNTRTTQLFVNLVNNFRLDRLGFTPVGRVVEGMEVVDSLYGGYGEGRPPAGARPGPHRGRGERVPRARVPQARLHPHRDGRARAFGPRAAGASGAAGARR